MAVQVSEDIDTCRGNRPRQVLSDSHCKVFDRCPVIVVSTPVVNWLAKTVDYPPADRFIPNGIDTEHFRPGAKMNSSGPNCVSWKKKTRRPCEPPRMGKDASCGSSSSSCESPSEFPNSVQGSGAHQSLVHAAARLPTLVVAEAV